MPFRSEAERRFLEKFHPDIAKKWAEETAPDAKLPERAPERVAFSAGRRAGKTKNTIQAIAQKLRNPRGWP